MFHSRLFITSVKRTKDVGREIKHHFGAYFFPKNNGFQSAALIFLMLGFSVLVIDYFSEDRASIYYSEVIKVLK